MRVRVTIVQFVCLSVYQHLILKTLSFLCSKYNKLSPINVVVFRKSKLLTVYHVSADPPNYSFTTVAIGRPDNKQNGAELEKSGNARSSA